MLDRALSGAFRWAREDRPVESRKPSRSSRRPQLECLEARLVLNASIGSIPNVSVQQSTGYQVALDGSASGAPKQTFTVSSDNPDIKVSVAQGKFITLNVTHTASSTPGDVSFTGPITYQAFNDLAPNTASRIETLTNGGGFNATQIFRVEKGFVFQAGPQGSAGNGNNTLELNQQLTFEQPNAVAIANANDSSGKPGNTDGNQFFVNFVAQNALNYRFSIYGLAVSGQTIINDIQNVATSVDPVTRFPTPINPIVITTSTVSTNNPNGVVHVDATGAVAGEHATVKVIATDPSTNTTAQTTFQVTVVTDTTPRPATLTYTPLAFPVTQAVATGAATSVQLVAHGNNPNNSAVVLSYALASQPTHGKITNFNAAAGTLTYTPNPGFTGSDTFRYSVTNTGGTPSPLAGNTQTVTLNVSNSPLIPVNTGAVRQVGNVLVVTPLPRTDKGTNTIIVAENVHPSSPASNTVAVTINGQLDTLQPLASSLDRVVVFGSKANDQITADPTLDSTIKVTLDGGHGGTNVLQAGVGSTREHGWFGHNTLKGGTGPNQLIGGTGHVRFVATSTSNPIFAGAPGVFKNGRVHPPTGTFYKFVNGKLVPIPTPAANQVTRTPTTTKSTHTTKLTAKSTRRTHATKTPAKSVTPHAITPHANTTKK